MLCTKDVKRVWGLKWNAAEAGRHPTLEVILAESGQHFEPVDFFLGESCFFQIVTGHNGTSAPNETPQAEPHFRLSDCSGKKSGYSKYLKMLFNLFLLSLWVV